MKRPSKTRRPPTSGQFRKGVSGNPKGRPKGTGVRRPSAFEIVFDKTVRVMQNGQPHELTIEEALQLRTFQDALAGNRAARREVLKMIAAREEWLAKRPPKLRPIEQLMERDPLNAHDALILLGLAERHARWPHNDPHDHLLLLPWAVQAALSRPGRRQLSTKHISEIKRCTRDAETLRWPAGAREKEDA